MTSPSTSRLLDLMGTGPQTRGWGAILAFSRHDLDRLLEQSQLARYGRALHLAPFEGFIGDRQIAGQYFDACTFGAAHVSLEGADLQQDAPGLRLSMQLTGGRQLTLEQVQGHLEVTGLWLFDALHGLQLSLELALHNAPPDANRAGQVLLDLREGGAFKFGFSGLPQERFIDTEPFDRLFKSLSDAQGSLPLVTISQAVGQVIEPASVSIRTQPAPQPQVHEGDGALLLLVAMHGQPEGEPPGADFPWLLADAAGAPRGTSLVLSNRLLIDTLVGAQWLAATNGQARWQVLNQASGFVRLQPTAGYFMLRPVFYHDPVETMWATPVVYLDAGAQAWAEVSEEQLCFELIGNVTQADTSLNLKSNQRLYAALIADWHLRLRSGLAVDPVQRTLEPVYPAAPQVELTWQLDPCHPHDPQALQAVAPSAADRDERLREFLASICTQTLTVGPALERFIGQVPAFDAPAALLAQEVLLPGDLLIRAQVGPPRACFWLDPPQSLLGLGESLQLRTTTPGLSGLNWTAHNLFDSRDACGSISPDGLYTAPDHLEGSGLSVCVTAQTDGHSASALIQLVANTITINPVVQIVQRGQRCLLAAAATTPGPLTWSLADDRTGGRLIPGPEGVCAYQASDRYQLPEYGVDQIIVRDELSGHSQSAWVMTLFASMTHSIVPDYTFQLAPGQLKLQVLHGGNSLVPSHQLSWQVLAGDGEGVVVDADGIYTQPPVLRHNFVLLLATQRQPGRVFNGCLLLPLPLLNQQQTSSPGLRFKAV
ncbi:putative uncharacterized protein [Pseudomonas sp. StFLB209]|uniref:hypothetical protein n=1 Tax=Pseudomonas sp. StFLB209 TaxID=1028989 RepID=UPI0004F71CE8|nr:hypothetical protein [Pseudomonas sp. StFLB209]BAP44568.1 putative uncharacterized protein [Pseudomonas sp. StFLB209]